MNFPRTRFKSNLRKFNLGLAFMVRQMCVRVPCGVPPYTPTPCTAYTHTQNNALLCVGVFVFGVSVPGRARCCHHVTRPWARFKICLLCSQMKREWEGKGDGGERQQAVQEQENVQINFYKFLRGISFAIHSHSHSCRCPKMPAQSVTVTVTE